MVWDYAEANPFGDAAGDYGTSLESLAKVLCDLCTVAEGHSRKHDATQPIFELQDYLVISTDPPYYDNIGYADLSDYFYVWMRRSLRSLFPDDFGTIFTPKDGELIASPYRHGGDRDAANRYFEDGLRQAFLNGSCSEQVIRYNRVHGLSNHRLDGS